MENQIDRIPEKWWTGHMEQIIPNAKGRAERIFSGIAHDLNWPKMLDGEEDFLELMKELEPKFDMPAPKLVDMVIDTAWTEAVFEIFQEQYGHLCNRDEAGEILIPVHCIPEMHGLSEEETESRIQALLKEHPEAVFCVSDPMNETIN